MNYEENEPLAEVGEFAELEVVSTQSIGTFLDWGKPKDLFLPFSEQTRDIRVGDRVIVYLFVDNNERSCASMKVEKFIDRSVGDLYERDEVDLFVVSETELGFKAVINNRHLGVLYRNEVFQALGVGDRVRGYVKKIREDGKIDLCLQQSDSRYFEAVGDLILSQLKTHGGYLAVGDKSSAEEIYELLGVSKKKFKMALGGLYKRQLVKIEEDGIRISTVLPPTI